MPRVESGVRTRCLRRSRQCGASRSHMVGEDRASRKKSCGAPARRRSSCIGSRHARNASDPSDDYIYGSGTTPVEEVSLATSTPTYTTYTASDSTWLITNAAGDETAFYGYDAFGNLAFGTPTSPFGYGGQYTDPSTGFSNLRARWYVPQTGTFTTRDPAFASTDTAYTYSGDDPVNRTDPTGEMQLSRMTAAFLQSWGISTSKAGRWPKFTQEGPYWVYTPVDVLFNYVYGGNCVSFLGVLNVGTGCGKPSHDSSTGAAVANDSWYILWNDLYQAPNEYPPDASCQDLLTGRDLSGGYACFVSFVVTPTLTTNSTQSPDQTVLWLHNRLRNVQFGFSQQLSIAEDIDTAAEIAEAVLGVYVTPSGSSNAACGAHNLITLR